MNEFKERTDGLRARLWQAKRRVPLAVWCVLTQFTFGLRYVRVPFVCLSVRLRLIIIGKCLQLFALSLSNTLHSFIRSAGVDTELRWWTLAKRFFFTWNCLNSFNGPCEGSISHSTVSWQFSIRSMVWCKIHMSLHTSQTLSERLIIKTSDRAHIEKVRSRCCVRHFM